MKPSGFAVYLQKTPIENSLSDGTDVQGIAKYFRAKIESYEFFCHFSETDFPLVIPKVYVNSTEHIWHFTIF